MGNDLLIEAQETPPIRINRRKIKTLINNSLKSAEAINLVYVTDKQNGISRIKKGDEFIYVLDDKPILDEEILARIRGLVLPPAWKDVWICSLPNGHLQAIGVDNNGRKQYRYHPLWNALRSETKFFHLYDFGKALLEIRRRVYADLALPGLPQRKVTAAIISLMEYTGIRIGSNIYEKLYGSFGLTTLKDKHVRINGSELKFGFKGKKGIYQNFTLKSKKLARIIKQCKEIPGKELFQYIDENGIRKSIDSGMVNAYLKEISGRNFTSKDFRTWTGTLSAIKAFIELGYCETVTETKRKINEALDEAANQLGNTRSVCKKYYVHPIVIDHYTNKTIEKYIGNVSIEDKELTPAEQILMKMLGDIQETSIPMSK